MTTRLSYRDAGVDIDAGDLLVERIKGHVRRTHRPEVMGGLGGFAGLCAIPGRYKEPLLVSCTDGVGTKLKLAFLTGRHDTVGIDLVAMNVNDLVVCGGEPLFFLDYFASGKLEVGVAEQVIAGIADGCRQAGCALLGGETAEMPGFYAGGRVRPGRLLRGRRREEPPRRRRRRSAPGDKLLGLASSGFHSNGYSLVRKVFLEECASPLDAAPPGLDEPLGRGAPAPHPHLRPLDARAGRRRPAARRGPHHRRRPGRQPDAHDPRRRAAQAAASARQLGRSRRSSSCSPRAAAWPPDEMRRTFNMGLGMLVCVPADREADAVTLLERSGEQVFSVGQVAAADAPDAPVEFLTQ